MEYFYDDQKPKRNRAKKVAIVNTVLILMVVAFFFGYTYTLEKINKTNETKTVAQNVSVKSENAPNSENKNDENVVNPNSQLDITYNYSCGHSVEKIEPVAEMFSGKTKEQIEAVHTNCIVESVSPRITVMSIYLEEICNDHYVVKLDGDYIKACNKNSQDKVEKKMKVDRAMLYDEDIKILEAGVEIASMEELLEFFENFSS